MKYLFRNDKNIYKANLHCHTTISDGKNSPEEIKKIYQDSGYQIVAYTDHNKLVPHMDLNDENFLAVHGVEYGINQDNGHKCYHFNLYALNQSITETPAYPDMKYDDTIAINQYIEERVKEGFLVCYNHPYWSMQTWEDYGKLKGCFAMEIYNHGCEVSDGYYGYNPQVYDEMLREGNKIFCVSADDNHNRASLDALESDSFGGFVRINSENLNYSNIMAALSNGDFYASQGPEIYEISLDDGKLAVKCSPAALIVVYTDTRKCYIARGAPTINRAEFQLLGKERYIRVMCRDVDKKDANSNAYWLL